MIITASLSRQSAYHLGIGTGSYSTLCPGTWHSVYPTCSEAWKPNSWQALRGWRLDGEAMGRGETLIIFLPLVQAFAYPGCACEEPLPLHLAPRSCRQVAVETSGFAQDKAQGDSAMNGDPCKHIM
jgi:hypothetical protein